MGFVLNIIWFILGGWLSGLLWLLGGVCLALLVVTVGGAVGGAH